MRRSIARSSIQMETLKPQFRQSSPSSSSSRLPLLSRLLYSYNLKNRSNLCIAFALISFALVIFSLFSILRSDGDRKFGIVIDGGSTGTRVHVYSYFAGTELVDIAASATMKVNPGLSAYKDNPDQAGESLKELLDFARRRIRADIWGVTEVRLMATAGMRLLDTGVQEKILESCRNVLRISGFMFRKNWATVIAGSDEGIYAWVTANYALGTLGSVPQKTTGIIELGGASAQITFVSSESLPSELSQTITIGKTTYNLYSHSFLHFGQNVAYDSLYKSTSQGNLNSHPCIPRGYSLDLESKFIDGILSSENRIATGNYSECRSASLSLLHSEKDNCAYKICNMGSVFVPELKGKFLATENFFYTSKFFGLGSSSFLSDMVIAGKQFCEDDWVNLKRKYHFSVEEDLMRHCFSSAYIVAMLHDSLGIPLDDRRIVFANEIGDIPLDWALGAFIMNRMSDIDREQPESISSVIRSNSSALKSALVMSLFIFIVWWISRWKKPQLKTIYDLEKGRYIISRVSP